MSKLFIPVKRLKSRIYELPKQAPVTFVSEFSHRIWSMAGHLQVYVERANIKFNRLLYLHKAVVA